MSHTTDIVDRDSIDSLAALRNYMAKSSLAHALRIVLGPRQHFGLGQDAHITYAV